MYRRHIYGRKQLQARCNCNVTRKQSRGNLHCCHVIVSNDVEARSIFVLVKNRPSVDRTILEDVRQKQKLRELWWSRETMLRAWFFWCWTFYVGIFSLTKVTFDIRFYLFSVFLWSIVIWWSICDIWLSWKQRTFPKEIDRSFLL